MCVLFYTYFSETSKILSVFFSLFSRKKFTNLHAVQVLFVHDDGELRRS